MKSRNDVIPSSVRRFYQLSIPGISGEPKDHHWQRPADTGDFAFPPSGPFQLCRSVVVCTDCQVYKTAASACRSSVLDEVLRKRRIGLCEEINLNRDINITHSRLMYVPDYCPCRCHRHVHARASTACVLYGHLSVGHQHQHRDSTQPASREMHW